MPQRFGEFFSFVRAAERHDGLCRGEGKPGPRKRSKLLAIGVVIAFPREIGPDPAPCRQPQGRRQLAIARRLIGFGQRLVGEIPADGVLGKAAADGKGGSAAAPFAAGTGQGKGGICLLYTSDAADE